MGREQSKRDTFGRHVNFARNPLRSYFLGRHVNFARDQLRSYFDEYQKNEILL